MEKILTAMVNERGRVLATGSATFRLQDRMHGLGIVNWMARRATRRKTMGALTKE